MPLSIFLRRIPARSASGLALLFLLLLTIACDGDATGPGGERGTPGLHIVAGAGATDTIGAALTQALVVGLFDEDGRPATGVVVRFEMVDFETPVFVSRLDATGPGALAVDTPDARGRAAARVHLGQRIGTGRVAVVVPELGLSDTATFAITPGAPTSMTAAPEDTAAFVGNGYTVSARVLDRAGNPLDRPAQITRLSGPVSVAGHQVTGTAVGRGSIEVRADEFVDTAWVTVVPAGTLAAYSSPPSTGYAVELYTFGLDGSDLRLVATTKVGEGYFGEMPATWSADGSRLVYHDNNWDHTRTLFEVDLATLTSTPFIDNPGSIQDERWPLFSPGGEWVLFNGGTYWDQTAYRVRADGTEPTPIGPTGALHASMSPDGSRIAYQLGDGLEVMDLGSGARTSLGVRGWLPVWAPSGDEIYYTSKEDDFAIAGRVRAIRPDGAGDRAVSSSRIRWRVTVSPDGEWLVGAADGSASLVLIDPQTGAELPLPLALGGASPWEQPRAFSAPVWRP